MKRLLFYFFRLLAFCSRVISHKLYISLIVQSYQFIGVKFVGRPASLDLSAYIDPSGGLTIEEGCGISVNAIVLTHDWSFLRRYKARNIMPSCDRNTFDKQAFRSVILGAHSLVGAGAIVLPGSIIGKYCIIGAGAVIKGVIDDYSIMVGNPAKKIGDTRDSNYRLL